MRLLLESRPGYAGDVSNIQLTDRSQVIVRRPGRWSYRRCRPRGARGSRLGCHRRAPIETLRPIMTNSNAAIEYQDPVGNWITAVTVPNHTADIERNEERRRPLPGEARSGRRRRPTTSFSPIRRSVRSRAIASSATTARLTASARITIGRTFSSLHRTNS
jgi:hypothetical protein